MKYPYWEVGQRIGNLRREYGYSQEKLAEMADISIQFLSEIERGKKTNWQRNGNYKGKGR